MSFSSEELNALKALPCFTKVTDVELLADGLSHTCAKVTTAAQIFFAKKLNTETANAEVLSTLVCSSAYLSNNLNANFSPRVIYHDEHWLVTQFVDGITLATSALNNNKRTAIGLALMAKLHQLITVDNIESIPLLNTTKSANRLFSQPIHFCPSQRSVLADITQTLTSNINSQIATSHSSIVLCHGDINYTNILIDKVDKTWLIDFECAHLAPVEFDLGMFIAVNNISTENMLVVIDDYEKRVGGYQANHKLLTYYILYSYFINGLWYLDNNNSEILDEKMYSLALAQWAAFDDLAFEHSITMPKLTAIINPTGLKKITL